MQTYIRMGHLITNFASFIKKSNVKVDVCIRFRWCYIRCYRLFAEYLLESFSTFSTKAGKVESRKVCCVQSPNIALSITKCREIKESQICYSMDQGLFKKATNVKIDCRKCATNIKYWIKMTISSHFWPLLRQVSFFGVVSKILLISEFLPTKMCL
jgi:hypothetical protein